MTQAEDDMNADLLPYWKAPELLKHGLHTMATDVYAFGMLLYEVLFRRDPFAGESTEVRGNSHSPSKLLTFDSSQLGLCFALVSEACQSDLRQSDVRQSCLHIHAVADKTRLP